MCTDLIGCWQILIIKSQTVQCFQLPGGWTVRLSVGCEGNEWMSAGMVIMFRVRLVVSESTNNERWVLLITGFCLQRQANVCKCFIFSIKENVIVNVTPTVRFHKSLVAVKGSVTGIEVQKRTKEKRLLTKKSIENWKKNDADNKQ